MEREGDGDFGARDPYDAEIATQFGNKAFGHADTDHITRAPTGIDKFLGLKSKHCAPCTDGKVPLLSKEEVEALRTQVGWKLVTLDSGVQGIRHEWKAKNFEAALAIFGRIAEVAEAEGHHPDLHLENYNAIRVEMTTHAASGLTLNDFIMATKINALSLADLLSKRKAKYWA